MVKKIIARAKSAKKNKQKTEYTMPGTNKAKYNDDVRTQNG